MKDKISEREYILKLLYKLESDNKYSNLVRDELFKEGTITESQKAFINQLFFGVLSRKITIDAIIAKNSKIKANKISPWINNILRIGIYQIIYLEKIPVSAACNESVKLARKYGHSASAGFVNAILRNVAAQVESLKDNSTDSEKLTADLLDISKSNTIKKISLLHSHPEWMVEEWIRQLGEEFTEDLCRANNQTPQTSIRVNITKAKRETLLELLGQNGLDCELSKYSEQGIIIKKGSPINQYYNEGLYSVQDEAAMLVAEILSPNPGEVIADVCSAPGGKTAHIAELMGNKGKIFAFDIHEHRLELVKKTVERLGIGIVEPMLFDAAKVNSDLAGKCDKVLVDAPCSGLGVIRRKPEIKWTRNRDDIKELVKLQKRILSSSAGYVKPGGRLVYSTCTLNNEENEKVIEDFLKNSSNFDIDFQYMEKYCIINKDNGLYNIKLYPNINNTDGFFICAFKRL